MSLPQLSQGHSQMLFTVIVLTPSATFVMTHSNLDDAVAYAHRAMLVTGDAIDIVVTSTANGVAKVVKRYHHDES